MSTSGSLRVEKSINGEGREGIDGLRGRRSEGRSLLISLFCFVQDRMGS